MIKLFTIVGYTIRAHILPIPCIKDLFSFVLTGSWGDCRFPNEERELVKIILPRTGLAKLGSLINLALANTWEKS